MSSLVQLLLSIVLAMANQKRRVPATNLALTLLAPRRSSALRLVPAMEHRRDISSAHRRVRRISSCAQPLRREADLFTAKLDLSLHSAYHWNEEEEAKECIRKLHEDYEDETKSNEAETTPSRQKQPPPAKKSPITGKPTNEISKRRGMQPSAHELYITQRTELKQRR